MDEFDIVIIGSGINSLVAAALLARKGRKVCVLERNGVLGGAIRTEEITAPGYRHDLMSMSYPLFVTTPHYPLLKDELEANGLRFVTPTYPTGVLAPDGRFLLQSRAREETVAAMEALSPGDGEAFRRMLQDVERDAPLIFGLLGQEPWSWKTARLLAGNLFRRGPRGLAGFVGAAMKDLRPLLRRDFRSELSRGLVAPWVLHLGLGPESPISAMMAKVVMLTLEMVGIPFVVGGSANIVEAFRRTIEAHGGTLRTGVDVARIIVEGGKATGVETSGGQRIAARKAVVANATPTQLYGRLLAGQQAPAETRAAVAAFTYGLSDMQIHIALSEPPQWSDPRLGEVGLLHLTPGLDGVSRAVNEAQRGLLPAEATVVVGQPAAADPSRCPPGASLLWIQLQELPPVIRGDAAGEIETPPDGAWTEAVREAYKARILRRLARHVANLDTAMIKAVALSPADLERYDINLVGGDPYSGACSVDQFHLWRPFPGARNHRTFVDRLFHIGASTHPGPGLGGMSGYFVAEELG